jgi:hypothetical protein
MPSLLTSGLVIDHLAHRVRNYRNLRKGLREMSFEHKALRTNWAAFRKNLDALNTALAKGNDAMPGVTTNVTGILGQVQGINDDVAFMGTMLGNGSGSGLGDSETDKGQPKTPPAVQEAETQPPPVLPPQVQQTGITVQPLTFRAEAEQQIAAGHKP